MISHLKKEEHMRSRLAIILTMLLFVISISGCRDTDFLGVNQANAVRTSRAKEGFVSVAVALTLSAKGIEAQPQNTQAVEPASPLAEQPTSPPLAQATQVPAATEISLGSISGFVWEEDCDNNQPKDESCITDNEGQTHGDGIYKGEFLIVGLTVELVSGNCNPSGSAIRTSIIDQNDAYFFGELTAGTYCVRIPTYKYENPLILFIRPGEGEWTFPQRGDQDPQFETVISAGENKSGINFGWDDWE
jgi:hypothetical protein